MSRRHGDPTGPARAVPWVSSMVYAIVGVAGLYFEVADLDGDGARAPARTAGFAGCLALLFALEYAERRSFPVRTPGAAAVAFLSARAALFVAVSALDPSGLSRALFVLVPFAAYLAFGRAVSLVLAAVCLALLLGGYTLWVPGWYTEATYVSDLLMFAVGLALAIAMAGIAVREQRGRLRLEESHARLSAYADRVAELSAAAERNRLARDMHDSLGHHLTAVAVQLEKAAEFGDLDRAVADQALADARSSARRALEDVRNSVRALRAEGGGRRLLPALADLVRQTGGGGPEVVLTAEGEEEGWDEATLMVLYRACQEALTNARRHARADRVRVAVVVGADRARLDVEDDGVGLFATAREPSGVGLLGMRERAALVGGSVRVDERPGGGTRVTVVVPRPARPGPDAGPGARVAEGSRG
ncbi:sensor histidine kinase [Nocardiopsis aegyptia]|uniref:histidine kinase n=1 Tax=Nocardiopsis aegyptia TaxID=220378 RepID=A0A7Z0ETJ3_9ACTN|nr:sensor histidine kinase [Nocardiopsis aegyptia]NYJ37060.1 signal transduction histidine kinase [Nocardiopsis aegyptia]